MRSRHSPFVSPVGSPVMSPRRPSSPQPSRSRTQNSAKSLPGSHLGNLPRFHSAVYQSTPSGHSVAGQPPSPRQTRQCSYRPSSSFRDMKWQYRDLLDGSHQSPEAPRLDPLLSPGPVTPLALEANDYLAALSSSAANHHIPRENSTPQSGPAPDMIDKLIARENEKARKRKAGFSK
ncbi:hypothetical protein N7456_006783 [Penicillium angulare]|uniref:Uncharacterized protein n=1 Tax=Penicillium angulare TaxID=116970 RepID=A0A9W9FIB2_9EURO|nr:hypothetical protein N7456_006783 [Penicillium angulare]